MNKTTYINNLRDIKNEAINSTINRLKKRYEKTELYNREKTINSIYGISENTTLKIEVAKSFNK